MVQHERKRMLIFAGSRRDADEYIETQQLSRCNTIVVQHENQLMGLNPEGFDHVCVGSWTRDSYVYWAYQLWKQKLRGYAVWQRKKQPSQAALDVLAERERHITGEGFTLEHDDSFTEGELAEAAVAFASHAAARSWVFRETPEVYRNELPFPKGKEVFGHGCVTWPKSWSWDWWKPKDPRRDLVRAAALLIAEIERLDRIGAQK